MAGLTYREPQLPSLFSLDGLFDLFTLLVNAADVISDIAICIAWYRNAHMTFFWLSIGVFLLSQIAYSVFFVLQYSNSSSRPYKWLLFACVFPFAQLVPFVVMFQAYKVPCVNAVFQRLSFRQGNAVQEYDDPLLTYIRLKMRVHGGFIMESLVESIPQSILQMLALVLYKENTFIAVFSIATSMLSIASRGFIWSYSPHLPTFAFNIFCVVADIVGVFCAASWILLIPGSGLSSPYHLPLFPGVQLASVWSVIWIYSVVILTLAYLITGLSIFVTRLNSTRKDELVGSALLGLIMLPILVFVIEGFNFTALPLFVLSSGQEGVFRRNLAHFFAQSVSTKDRQIRITFARQHFARQHLTGLGFKKELKYRNMTSTYTNTETYKLAYAVMTHGHHEAKGRSDEQALKTVLKPTWIVTSAYAIIYPFICVTITPWRNVAMIQRTLTLAYAGSVFLLCVLAPSVYRFYSLTPTIQFFWQTPGDEDLRKIQRDYNAWRKEVVSTHWGLVSALVASQRAVPGVFQNHMANLLPTINAYVGRTESESETKPVNAIAAAVAFTNSRSVDYFTQEYRPREPHPSDPLLPRKLSDVV